jgi:hypothetical protein
VVESCNASADTCTFEAVDPVLGTVRGASTVSASPGSTDEVSATATQGTLVAAVGWEHIVGFDPATAAVKWKWPG